MSESTQWYKDAIIYELHVRAFFDGNDDGKGDFAGLTNKLDYLQDLGVTALWLLPFYPSPLRDDGYDIADHFNIHPDYGTLAEFKRFLKEAKRRGLRVITELVLNHTSDQHELFQKARRASAGSPARDFYVWSDDPQKYQEARIIFQDFESSNWTWDPVAKAYYWHRFYAHQPDLNFDHPEVRKYMLKVVDFWLGLGVDGLRLDAVPYLFEREGTNCENLPETHAFLKELRLHVDRKFSGRMLLAEANQWPEEASAYFGAGDECHMAFHFPLMPRLFMALHMEDCFPVVDILQQTPDVSGRGQWAIFLRNHDELTLEMVTDEERDYMYRYYARDPKARINLGIRRRLAPLLGNHRRKVELLNGLLLSLPGTPVLYYGDEIGMGDNIHLGDRNGVRTPMLWSADRNAGFSRANPQSLYLPITIDPEYHYEAVNVDIQQNNPHSLFWWMKRLIDLRKRYKAFGSGSLEFVACENRKILSFIRSHDGERILVVANLSRFVQLAELDLAGCKGMALVEMFGRFEFPPLTEKRCMLTLAPHSFYWFRIRQPTAPEVDTALVPAEAPAIEVSGGAAGIFSGKADARLCEAMKTYLRSRHWFAGKSHQLRSVRILDEARLRYGESAGARICLLRVEFLDASPETYLLPITIATEKQAQSIRQEHPFSILAELRRKGGKTASEGVLFDAVADPEFCAALLAAIRAGRRLKSRAGDIVMTAASAFAAAVDGRPLPEPALAKTVQRNTSVLFGDRLILKLFRRIYAGENPDAEISRHLAQAGFPYSPALAGEISYRPKRGESTTLAVLHVYVPNRGEAWQYTLDTLRRYFDDLTGPADSPKEQPVLTSQFLELLDQEPTPLAAQRIGAYLETAKLLGKRTAELHKALADGTKGTSFAPEDFSELYQRSLYQSLRTRANDTIYLLRRKLNDIPELHRPLAETALGKSSEILRRFRGLVGKKLSGQRIRCHGDYHLKQVLYTGTDFQIFDFEGPAAQVLHDRRIKKSPLRDVAGMLRSFEYAAYTILLGRVGVSRAEDAVRLEPWARFWCQWVSAAFLRSYLETIGDAAILPKSRSELDTLLGVLLLERTVEEIRNELESHPEWAVIPLKGLTHLLGA
ncbi:MAG: maltose alpha-D-glucosyltransferase [Elusimicrobia bacterium GWA2_69_24]|nr:MAG: maltose alpha-D-glucosyltransferase [Elusimicrobia bacterium GWA2_69_24]HBL17328.1 maltose alpha-D-glucosyltransferase [Elusimicrobiota bacterium]